MSEDGKIFKAVKKGYKEGPPPGLSARVLAATGFIIVIAAALIFEYWLKLGREFLIVIILWMVMLLAAKYHLRFPEDQNK